MNTKLDRVHIAGFRSLRELTLDLTPVTVLIGPNGAGKSNLLWALEMARFIAFESLQLFVGERGGASYLVHYGPRKTQAIDLDLMFSSAAGEGAYHARLGYGSNESLMFLEEKVGFRQPAEPAWRWSDLGTGHAESKLKAAAAGDASASTIRDWLRQINFYHFHDTSRLSPLRTRDFADLGSDWLRSDGSNLANFLDGLRLGGSEEDRASWQRLLFHVTSIAPFITDLTPVRDRHGVALQWVDETGTVLGPAHLSDGTLRAIALFAALDQPRSTLPIVSCFDEPELGLHPAALELLAGAVRSVASSRQVLISTQSSAVLDLFAPGQVVVAERRAGATVLRRLVEADLADWLSEYRLSEIYDSNLLGGRP